MAITRPDIAEAKLTQIHFIRLPSGTPPIQLELRGEILDANGAKITEEVKYYDWSALPAAWQKALLPILRAMSKEFNNLYAASNVETL